MTGLDVLYNELKCDLFAELKNSIMEELKPFIRDMILQTAKEIKVEEEYQLMEWFIQKYRISKKTFFKYKKLGYVDSKQVGRYKLYSVKEWIGNLDKIKTGKPDFLKIPLSKVG